MTSLRCLAFLLFFLLLHKVYCEEPEPVFRALDSAIEIGYCFGVDYMVVYRSAQEGDQLLGNSSASEVTVKPPAYLQDRIHLSWRHYLLGLQISNLTYMDSGIYRRECWQDHILVSQLTQQLSVCHEEVDEEEIILKEEAGGTELLCNSTFTGLEGTSVRWYYEMYPSYKITLFLDSSVSLEPLVEELQGMVEVKDKGVLLVLDNSMLKKIQHFHCLVIKGNNCLSFQNMYLQDRIESRDIFASRGDRVVLNCPSDGNNQQWETPQGRINGSSTSNDQMYISVGEESEDFSLVIPAVTDEHSGEYSCISSSLELQYLLVLCPKRKTREKIDFEGRNVTLECKVDQDDANRVQWYHRGTSGEYKLIHNSDDKTIPIPEDLRSRLTLSDNGSLLMISDVGMEDSGVYCCVALGGPEFLEEEDDYKYDYNEEDTEDNEFGDDQHLHDANRCIFKQETILTLLKTVRGDNLEHVTFRPENRNPGISPTADLSAAPDITAYVVGTALVGLLLVGVIAAVCVIHKKKAASRSGLNKNTNIKMSEDLGCTKRLTVDEYSAEELS